MTGTTEYFDKRVVRNSYHPEIQVQENGFL